MDLIWVETIHFLYSLNAEDGNCHPFIFVTVLVVAVAEAVEIGDIY